MVDPELREAEEARSAKLLDDAAALLRARAPGVACVGHCLIEHTWESVSLALCAEAERLNADVMVVAATGKNWAQEALMGSLTNYAVHHSTVPVLAIPPASRPRVA